MMTTTTTMMKTMTAFAMKLAYWYQCGNNGVEKDGSDLVDDLVEECPWRHEVPGFHDDRRQDDREE